jgi:hypothetical protein
MRRRAIYAQLSQVIGRDYHTGELRTIEEARKVYAAVLKIAGSVRSAQAVAAKVGAQ